MSVAGIIGDVSGDGYADLVVMQPNGILLLYPNNINSSSSNPKLPFTTGTQIGTGFNVFDIIRCADISGDGYADLVCRQPDGTLMYYPNNINGPTHKPYDSGSQIGSGWEIFNQVALGDINGDGYADLLGLLPNGTLMYYPNAFAQTPAKPYSSGVAVGTGFQVFDLIALGDFTGFGYTQLFGRKPDGTIWLCAPSIVGSQVDFGTAASAVQLGSGFQEFDRIAVGDYNGDRYADLLGRRRDGTLWYYPNQWAAQSQFFTGESGIPAGSGCQIFNKVA